MAIKEKSDTSSTGKTTSTKAANNKKTSASKSPNKTVRASSAVARIGGLKNRRPGGRGKVVVLLIILLGILYYFRSVFLVALVNNRPIFRTAVITEMEKQGGAQMLDSLITRSLVAQEAKKAGVVVTQSQIDEEINKLSESVSAQGQTLEQFLTFQGLSMEDLELNIEFQKMVEGLVADKIQVSAEEIASYIEENAGALPPEIGEEQIREQIKQQKLSTEFQALIANLKESSNIQYIRVY